MRKVLFIVVAILFFTAFVEICVVSAEVKTIEEPPFLPLIPQVMGQGSISVADSHGYNSLFYNPAGFAAKKGSITLVSMDTWMYSNPLRVYKLINEFNTGSSDFLSTINEQVTTGGVGIGFAGGMGFVTKGLGLGMAVVLDSYLYGPTLLGVEGDLTGTIGFIGGYAVSLNLLGLSVKIGGDIRPMVRVHVPLDNSDAIGLLVSFAQGNDIVNALNDVRAYHGFGLALDMGTIISMGPFKVGLSVRDFGGTRFYYTYNTVKEVTDSFQTGGGFPEGTEIDMREYNYSIPMNVSAGFAFHPDLGILSFIIDPSLHVDLGDMGSVITGDKSIWTLLHAGADVRLLSLFSVRAGINQGYITMGAGIKLLFLDFNMAVFTREMGKHVGDIPNSGVTLEAALRF